MPVQQDFLLQNVAVVELLQQHGGFRHEGAAVLHTHEMFESAEQELLRTMIAFSGSVMRELQKNETKKQS